MWKLGRLLAMFRKELRLAWAVLRDPRAPKAAKLVTVLAALYVISPVDFISDFIPVLSSNDVGVALMESIIKRLGTDDPEQWVPVFMAEAKAKNTHNLKAVK